MALNCPLYLSTEAGYLLVYLNRTTGSYPNYRVSSSHTTSLLQAEAIPKLARPSITAVLEAHRYMAEALAADDVYDFDRIAGAKLMSLAAEAYAHASALFDSLVDEETYNRFVGQAHRSFVPIDAGINDMGPTGTLFGLDTGATFSTGNIQTRMFMNLLRIATLGKKTFGFAADERSRGKAGWVGYIENWMMLMKRFTRIVQSCPDAQGITTMIPIPLEGSEQGYTPISGTPNRPFSDTAARLMTPRQFADLVGFICDAALSGNGAFVTHNAAVWPHGTPSGDTRGIHYPISKTLFKELGATDEQLSFLPSATYDRPDGGLHTVFRGVVDGRSFYLPTALHGQYNVVASRMMHALRARITSGCTKREAGLEESVLMQERLVTAGFEADTAARIVSEMRDFHFLREEADVIRRYPNTFMCNSCGQLMPRQPAAAAAGSTVMVGFGFGEVTFPSRTTNDSCAQCASSSRMYEGIRMNVRITANPNVTKFGGPHVIGSGADGEFDAHNTTAHCTASVVPRVDGEPVGHVTVRAGSDCTTIEDIQAFCESTGDAWDIAYVLHVPGGREVYVTLQTTRDTEEYTPGIDTIILRKRASESKFHVVRVVPGRHYAAMSQDGPVYLNGGEFDRAYTDNSGIVWRSADDAASNEPIYLTSQHQSTRFIDRAVGIEFETGTGFPVNNKCDAFLKFMKLRHAHTAAAPWAIKSDGSLASGAVEVVTPPMKGHAIEVGVTAYFDASEKFKFATENYQAGGHIHVEVTDMFAHLDALYNNHGRDKLRKVGGVIGYAMAAILKVARDFVSRRRREYHYCSGSPGVRRASDLIHQFLDHFMEGRKLAGLVTDGRAGLEFQFRNTVQGGNSYGGGNRRATNYTMEFRIWPSSNSAARVMARAELSQKMVEWVVAIVKECIENGCTNEAIAAATSRIDHLKSVLPLADDSGKFDELYNKRCTLVPAITEIFGLSPECAKVLESIHHQFFGPTYKAFETGDFSSLKSYGRSEDAKWGSACDTGVDHTGSNDINKELAYNDSI